MENENKRRPSASAKVFRTRHDNCKNRIPKKDAAAKYRTPDMPAANGNNETQNNMIPYKTICVAVNFLPCVTGNIGNPAAAYSSAR